MKIQMTGLDYKKAALAVREKFAISKEKAKLVMSAYMHTAHINACVVLSTCNRTEIYISAEKNLKLNITHFLCEILGLKPLCYSQYFTERNEKDTFFHMCKVASGIDSQILGDDSIITQFREALEYSRTFGFADAYMETMFRTAIKTAKEIKTQQILRDHKTASAPYKAIEKIKTLDCLSKKKAVVIGNGQMGRLAAKLLISEGSNVTVTLREYKKGKIQIPTGASTIPYSERYSVIDNAEFVISATTSPHYTLHYEAFLKLRKVPKIIIDLAVPRDIEPEIADISGVTLIGIDDLGDKSYLISDEKLDVAAQIIQKNKQNYDKWYAYKQSMLR